MMGVLFATPGEEVAHEGDRENHQGGVALALSALLAVNAAPAVAQAAGTGYTYYTTRTDNKENGPTTSSGDSLSFDQVGHSYRITEGNGSSISASNCSLVFDGGEITASNSISSNGEVKIRAGSIYAGSITSTSTMSYVSTSICITGGTVTAESISVSSTGNGGNAYIEIAGGFVNAGNLSVEG